MAHDCCTTAAVNPILREGPGADVIPRYRLLEEPERAANGPEKLVGDPNEWVESHPRAIIASASSGFPPEALLMSLIQLNWFKRWVEPAVLRFEF